MPASSPITNVRSPQPWAPFGKLDVFVGNAGIFDVYAKLAELPDDELMRAYNELFRVNVGGCIFGARAAVAELRRTGGSMIFTASVAGLNSGGGGALYTASKHAVVGLIRELAVELAPDIRVNGVAPGGTMTDLRGLAALGNDDRSQFADPAIEERLRIGQPAPPRTATRGSCRRLCFSRVTARCARHHRQYSDRRCRWPVTHATCTLTL